MNNDTKALFTCHNLRCTKQRELVYQHLKHTTAHPTAEELYQSISTQHANAVSRATVYNALDALVSNGLCRRITPETGPARFDADTTTHHHVVTDDGRVIDIPHRLQAKLPAKLPKALVHDLESALGISIDRVAFTIHAKQANPDAPNT